MWHVVCGVWRAAWRGVYMLNVSREGVCILKDIVCGQYVDVKFVLTRLNNFSREEGVVFGVHKIIACFQLIASASSGA